MATFTNITDRNEAGALIPEEVTREIFEAVQDQSIVMRLARKLPNMSRQQERMPVGSALVSTYFVDGDTGLVQTSEAAWQNKFINAGVIAAVVPIAKRTLDDLDYDFWTEVKPQLIEAIGAKFDSAVLYGGSDTPSNWPIAIVTGANNAGQNVSLAAAVDLYDAILGETGTLSFVEQDGYFTTGHVASLSMRSKLRGARDADGQPLWMTSMREGEPVYSLDGAPVEFPRNGAIVPASSLLISGDWKQLVWSVRTDINFDINTYGVLTNQAGEITSNLWQQGMVAMKIEFRAGWQLPNPVNRLNPTEATRYPFGVLVP